MINRNRVCTVLHVEDEPIQAKFIKYQLEKKGYSVHHVLNCNEAIEAALNSDLSFDLILIDIDLGSGLDGAAVAEEILKHIDIPIIFLSAHSGPEKIENISSYGYVAKSSNIEVLNVAIKMAIKVFDANMQIKRELEIQKKLKSGSV